MSFPRYKSYKDSGIEWLGKVPDHWIVAELKRRFQIIGGSTPKSDQESFWGGEIIWVTPADLSKLSSLYISDSHRKISSEGLASSGTTLVPKDSIILSTRAPIGSLAIAETNLCTNQGCKALVPFGATDAKFFGYLLSISAEELNIRGKGTTFLELSGDELSAFKVPVPSISEQQTIAAFLDRETAKIDALNAEQQRLIELLKEKRQAVISHAVTKGLSNLLPSPCGGGAGGEGVPMKDSGIAWLGEVPAHWKVGKCGFYISILSGYAFPSTGFTDNENATRLLRGINVGVSKLKWDETVYWQRSTNDGFDLYEISEGDLVIGMDRPLIAEGIRVAKVQTSDLPCLLLQRVCSLKTCNKLKTDFLLHLLSSQMFIAHFSPETTGVSVPHISPNQINNFVIPVPPSDEQETIISFINSEAAKLNSLTAEAQRGIALLKERRSALISAAVTGKIDVRGFVDSLPNAIPA